MSKFYILEPLREDVKKWMTENTNIRYVSSNLACNPEGYIGRVNEDFINKLRQFDGRFINIHEVPEKIMEHYEDLDDFITAYSNGDVRLNER